MVALAILSITSFSYGKPYFHFGQDTLQVGDRMPDIDMGILDNESKLGKFSAQKQRLVILDFMNSSCTSCIAALPRLSSLEEKFQHTLKIYPVTYETRSRIKNMKIVNETFSNTKLNFIVEDQQLKQLFPHQTVSHVVWILDGIIKAITHVEYVDEKMIATILKEGKLAVPQKNDFARFDYSKPLKNRNNVDKYDSFMTGFIQHAETKFGMKESEDSLSVREYMINVPILSAYMYAYGKVFKLPYMKLDRVFIDAKDISKYRFDQKSDPYESSWMVKNSISYEAVFKSDVTRKERMKIMIKDLDDKLNLRSSIEKRWVDCWIIIDGQGQNTSVFEDGRPIQDFVFMADLNQDFPPLINESKLNLKVANKPWQSFEELKKLLRASGYDLIKQKRQIEVFVLKD